MSSCPPLQSLCACRRTGLCFCSQYHDLGVEGGELWLATSSDRRVSVWASDWLQDKCELLDWLSFPAPAGPEVSVAPARPCLLLV